MKWSTKMVRLPTLTVLILEFDDPFQPPLSTTMQKTRKRSQTEMISNFMKKRGPSDQLTRKVPLRSSPQDELSESSNGTGARTSLAPLDHASSAVGS